ncbi:ATP-dependent DNA-helicase PIF1 [Sesbania bispinosa]|nr:ATP-dependent DNA-helicase PIF1 [Sesbania bispinosa]
MQLNYGLINGEQLPDQHDAYVNQIMGSGCGHAITDNGVPSIIPREVCGLVDVSVIEAQEGTGTNGLNGKSDAEIQLGTCVGAIRPCEAPMSLSSSEAQFVETLSQYANHILVQGNLQLLGDDVELASHDVLNVNSKGCGRVDQIGHVHAKEHIVDLDRVASLDGPTLDAVQCETMDGCGSDGTGIRRQRQNVALHSDQVVNVSEAISNPHLSVELPLDAVSDGCVSRLCDVPITVVDNWDGLNPTVSRNKVAVKGVQPKRKRGRPGKLVDDKMRENESNFKANMSSILLEKDPEEVANSVWQIRLEQGISGVDDELLMLRKLTEMEKREISAIGRLPTER